MKRPIVNCRGKLRLKLGKTGPSQQSNPGYSPKSALDRLEFDNSWSAADIYITPPGGDVSDPATVLMKM